ncbi:MAG: hypothetical protein QOK17_1791 [Sphingomonadales bacterium]|jgi:hypothetical protein|nr:hypothetical protein [Sphingomonadales bacterium]
MNVTPEVSRRARVSKTVHDLMCGVSEENLISDLVRVGAEPNEAAEILAEARKKLPEIRASYRAHIRSSAIWWIALGVIMLAVVLLIDPEKVPLLRRGRYFMGWILGAGATAYGGFRWLFPETGLQPIRNRYARSSNN